MPGSMSKANQRQHTRHERQYNEYRLRERRETNKLRKIVRHLRRYPGDDKTAMAAIDRLPAGVRRDNAALVEAARAVTNTARQAA